MNDLSELSKQSRSRKKESVPQVSKCQFMGCPLKASARGEEGWMCSFHESSDYHREVTQAINNNINFINAYVKMVKWNPVDWKENKTWLLTNLNCPMGEGELNSVYIGRFYKWLSDKIKNDAVKFIEGIN